jgi:hypothetical protein
MCDAQEERRVIDELELEYATEASVEVTGEQNRLVENLQIDLYGRG